MAADINNILQVFRRWNLEERSPILEDDLTSVLEKVGKIKKEESTALFEKVDADGDGRVNYVDLESWFLSHEVLRTGRLLQNCKCPDGHTLSTFTTGVDGWCCEECGEDLEATQEVLRCDESDGSCYCIRCMVQHTDIVVLEKTILTAIPPLAKRRPQAGTTRAVVSSSGNRKQVQAQKSSIEIEKSDDDEEQPAIKKRCTRSSLNFLHEGKDVTPAEEMYIEGSIQQLNRRGTQPKLDALEELAGLVKDSRLAATVCDHVKVLVMQLEKKEDTFVQLEVLSLLRRLVEKGQMEVIGVHAYAFSQCLSHEEMVVVRKAAMVFCTVAREGGAHLLTQYVPNLIDCFERLEGKISAPLEALRAIAEAGEGNAVAPTIPRLVPVLFSLNSGGRGAVCNTIVAIFRGGGGDPIFRTLIKDIAVEKTTANSDKECTLLGQLLLIVRDDEEDDDVRLLAAQALQAIILFKEDTLKILRSRHSLLLFNCLGVHYGKRDRATKEIRDIVKEILGIDLSLPQGPIASKNHDDEDGLQHCSICFTVGLRCQRGGPETLPCGHTFHAQCVGDWFTFETNSGLEQSCPLCRFVVPRKTVKDTSGAHEAGTTTMMERQNSVARLRATVAAARAFSLHH